MSTFFRSTSFFLLFLLFLTFFSVRPARAQFASNWKIGNWGARFGHAGLILEDIDEDGKDEIINNSLIPSTFGTNFWYVLENQGDSLQVEQTWLSDLNLWPTEHINLIPKADSSGYFYIQAVHLNFSELAPLRIQVYDFDTKTLIKEVDIDEEVRNSVIGDYNQDGQLELLVTAQTSYQIWSIPQLELVQKTERNINQFAYDYDPLLVDVDEDDDLELILRDIGTFAVQDITEQGFITAWEMRELEYTGSATDMHFYDFNQDGISDIIVLFEDHVRVYDPTVRRQIFSYAIDDISTESFDDRRIRYFALHDLDGDSIPEFIGLAYENIFICRLSDMALLETIPVNYGSLIWNRGNRDLYIGDTDGDGNPELIWGDGNDSNPPNMSRIFIQELKGDQDWWASRVRSLHMWNFQVDDIFGNGRKQIFHSNPVKDVYGLDQGGWTVYDAQTKAPMLQRLNSGGNLADGSFFNVFQLDSDPQREIIFDGGLGGYLIEVRIPSLQPSLKLYFDQPVSPNAFAMEQADIDLDGEAEIICALSTRSAADQGGSAIEIYDRAFNREWQIPHLDSYPFIYHTDLSTGNIDDDAAPEIVVLKTTALRQYFSILVIDGLDQSYFHFSRGEYPIGSLDVYDLDKDGIDEVILGRVNEIEIWDAQNQEIQRTIPLEQELFFPLVENVKVFDFDGDGQEELTITHDGKVKVISPISGEVFWESRFLGLNVSPSGRMEVEMVADTPRIYIGTEFFVEEFIYTGGNFVTNTVSNISGKEQILIYPNPATANTVQVKWSNDRFGPLQWQIVNLAGQVLRSGRQDHNHFTLDISSLEPGIYSVQLFDPRQGKSATRKLIRSK